MISKTAAPSNRQQSSRASRDADTSRLFPTKNDIPAEARSQIAELLNRRLADCIDLQTQCKQAHWNVKGPSFIGLHKLFDDINSDVEEYIDLLAERVVQLGGVAEGTARCVAERSTLSDYPGYLTTSESHVDALSSALAQFGAGARKAISQ